MKHIKRAAALALAVAMTLTMTACGNSGKADAKYRVGIIQQLEHQALDAATDGFKQALIDTLGEENVAFDFQNAQNDANNCTTIVTKFVTDKVDLIMANATTALQAAAAATDSIPVVGTSITDYMSAGVIDSNDKPGRNVTGASDLAPIDQQIALLIELCPDAKNIGIVYCSSEPNSAFQAQQAQKHLSDAGLSYEVFTFSDSNDMQGVLANAITKVDAIYIPTDNTAAENMEMVKNITVPAGIPVFTGEENMCSIGGLATLSISYYSMGYSAGQMAAEILKDGKNPAEMPIVYATETTRKYNADLAAELGWTIPEGIEPIG